MTKHDANNPDDEVRDKRVNFLYNSIKLQCDVHQHNANVRSGTVTPQTEENHRGISSASSENYDFSKENGSF